MIGTDNFALTVAVGGLAAICLLILALLTSYRLRRRGGMESEETWRGLAWVLTPVLIFALAAIPLLWRTYFPPADPRADLTIIVSGKMWTWTYRYPDQGNIQFTAPMLAAASANRGAPGSYDHIVVPVGKTVRIAAVSNNVVYSWGIPALGAAIEALPGRGSQSVFTPTEEGRYFGECLELCGLPHAFRPIEIEVVSAGRFAEWVAGARRSLTTAAAKPVSGAIPR